jgi:hypothetical protein
MLWLAGFDFDDHAANLRLMMPSWSGHFHQYAKLEKPMAQGTATDKQSGFIRFRSLSQHGSRYFIISVLELQFLNEPPQVSRNGPKYLGKPTAV